MARKRMIGMVMGAALSGFVAGGCAPKPISIKLKIPEGLRCPKVECPRKNTPDSNISYSGNILSSLSEICKHGKEFNIHEDGRILWGQENIEILRFRVMDVNSIGSTIALKIPGSQAIRVTVPFVSPSVVVDVKVGERGIERDVLWVCPPEKGTKKDQVILAPADGGERYLEKTDRPMKPFSLGELKIQRLKWNGYMYVPVDE
jgi:hypothetical protein